MKTAVAVAFVAALLLAGPGSTEFFAGDGMPFTASSASQRGSFFLLGVALAAAWQHGRRKS